MTAAERGKREREARDRYDDVQTLAMDEEITTALGHAARLPEPLGAAITAVFRAVEPFVAGDGHLAIAVVGRHSPEMMALARAVTTVATRETS